MQAIQKGLKKKFSIYAIHLILTKTKRKLVKNICLRSMRTLSIPVYNFIMQTLFSALDSLLDLPFPAFEKRLMKLEEEFKQISLSDISEEELE